MTADSSTPGRPPTDRPAGTARSARFEQRQGTALALAILLALIVIASACSSTPSTSPTTTTRHAFTVSTPGGTATLSLNGKLPRGWTRRFPVPPGASPAGSGSLENASHSYVVAVFHVPSSGEEALNYYKRQAPIEMQGVTSTGSGTSFIGSGRFSGQWNGALTIIGGPHNTLLVIELHALPT
jgi:hypothetical protein